MQRLRLATYAIGMFYLLNVNSALATDYYGQPGEFLRYSPSARALAMGRAYTAIGQDANALHWNPGALAQLQRTGLSVVGTQASLFGQSKYSSLSVGLPFEIINAPFFQKLNTFTVGLSFLNLTSDIMAADRFGRVETGSSLGSSQGAASLAIATSNNWKHLSNVSLGVGVDYIWNNLFGHQKSAVGFNAGLYYHNNNIEGLNWFSFALALKNVNEPNIAIDSQYEEIVPMTGRFGLAFLPPFCSALPSVLRPLIVSMDYDLISPSGNTRGLYLGLEYNVSRLQSYLPFRFRLGTNTKESSFTFGLSLDLPANPFMNKGLEYLPSLDYSFNIYNDRDYLGDVKQGGISFAWTPKTPEDWYNEGMTFFPQDLFSPANQQGTLKRAEEHLQRVFDNPQALSNPNYATYGYNALLRIGDLQLAENWLRNDRSGLLQDASDSYDKADKCISLTQTTLIDEENSTSLLYRLQGEIQEQRKTTEQLFQQPYVAMIDDRDHVQFLCGYSYFLEGNATKAESEWQSLDLPIAKFYNALANKDASALKTLAFSTDTQVEQKILYPFIPDFNIADNALFEYARLTSSKEWMVAILKLFPLSDMHEEIYKNIGKGSL